MRFVIPPPEGRRYADAQISPDGTMLAAAVYGSGGGGAPSIWLRPMDALEARQVPGTERAFKCFLVARRQVARLLRRPQTEEAECRQRGHRGHL